MLSGDESARAGNYSSRRITSGSEVALGRAVLFRRGAVSHANRLYEGATIVTDHLSRSFIPTGNHVLRSAPVVLTSTGAAQQMVYRRAFRAHFAGRLHGTAQKQAPHPGGCRAHATRRGNRRGNSDARLGSRWHQLATKELWLPIHEPILAAERHWQPSISLPAFGEAQVSARGTTPILSLLSAAPSASSEPSSLSRARARQIAPRRLTNVAL
jgi:hypothetical protein